MVNDYWTLRDDPEFIKSFLPGIENVLGWFTKRIDKETGMLGKVEYWNFVDWAVEWPWNNEISMGGVPEGGMKDGNSSILSMQFAYAAQRHQNYSNSMDRLNRLKNMQKLPEI